VKNIIIGILVVTSLALAGVLVSQRSKMQESKTKLVMLEEQVIDLEAAAEARDQETARLRQKLDQAQQESAVNAGTAAQLNLQLTNRIDEITAEVRSNTKPANPLTDMFKNPEMRDMIKQQQKTVFAGMVDKNYADFAKNLKLTPEQTEQLKDLVMKKMAVGADIGMEMMAGEMTPEQRQELMQRAKTSTDAANEEIKAFLGPENYTAFETYEKTVPDRMAVSTFRDSLSGGSSALSGDQEQALIQAMSAERQGFKFTTNLGDQNDFSADFGSKFTEANINTYLQEQEQLTQKYLTRAQTILSPDQYAAYEKSLKGQQEMMKMGMKMAASMFGNQGK
jgi:hypothetical protein